MVPVLRSPLLRKRFFLYNGCMTRWAFRQGNARSVRHRIGGFTAIEMVVVVGIIAIVSSIILIRFPVLSGNIHLQRSSRELALAFRKAQAMALSVRRVPGVSTPTSFGVSIDRTTSPITVLIFGDLSGNGQYDGEPADKLVESVPLDRSVTMPEILCNGSGTDQCTDTLDVSFLVPEARMSIYSNAGSEQSAVLTLAAIGSTYLREVVVRASGAIFIR